MRVQHMWECEREGEREGNPAESSSIQKSSYLFSIWGRVSAASLGEEEIVLSPPAELATVYSEYR